jgi:hypothetical protein
MLRRTLAHRSSTTEPPLMLLALALVVPAVALDHIAHADTRALVTMPVYQVLHSLADSLLALPLGALAVWAGLHLSARLGLGSRTTSDVFARATVITILFSLMLVPGALLHEVTDALTHAHLLLAVQSHAASATQSASPPVAVLAFLTHALADAIEGQLLGLPALTLAMAWKKGT